MEELYLEIIELTENKKIITTLESYITLFIYKYLKFHETNEIQLNFIENKNKIIDKNVERVEINLNDLKYNIYNNDNCPKLAKLCKLPVFINTETLTIIAGMCGVCRAIIKATHNDKIINSLLGFKTACLISPSEVSTWTKFCEIDIIDCIKSLNYINENFKHNKEEILLPDELARFECHMKQPVRVHNVYKLARNMAKENKSKDLNNDKDLDKLTMKMDKTFISSSTPINELNIEHKYVEGHLLTLADILVFICYNIIFNKINIENLLNIMPLTIKWYKNIELINNNELPCTINNLKVNNKPLFDIYQVKEFKITILYNVSLYKKDPKRYKPEKRIYTKQINIDKILEKITKLNMNINSDDNSNNDVIIEWNKLPYDVIPEGGNLPDKRLIRKTQQLECLAKEIIKLSKENHHIIDFCSGTGHLGILIAYLLPKCFIYILENKEESIERAKKRCRNLQLKNVLFLQTNLDYFIGKFDVGTSLHACGVATDIVLQICINSKANFVCCPCCYGGIHKMPHINYPRSNFFNENNINLKDYITIAHCADQVHVKGPKNDIKAIQGNLCMDIIDTDRKLYAEKNGYTVLLTKLQPIDCTPKNRLLIGSQ